MFSKPLSPFQEPKTNKSVFQSEPEPLPCFELNYKFLERHKKPLWLTTTRKQENPVNTAQKMASKSSTKQDGEATTEEVPRGRWSHIQKKNYFYISSDSFVLFGWNILYNPQINCLKSRVRL